MKNALTWERLADKDLTPTQTTKNKPKTADRAAMALIVISAWFSVRIERIP